ncbi:MAG: type II secretion system F family protein [Thermodesulfovibrionales bacterium]|nr:type II secretion system F family protein [Thermodesulfovibrionales bacterium]
MPIYNYKGFNFQGKEITGTIEASSITEAFFKVKAEGIYPSDIIDSSSKKLKKGFFQRSSSHFLQNFTRQFSILLNAGVPVAEAIQSIANENSGYYKKILVAIKDRISAGASLHRALQDFNDIYPDFYTNMIQVGEHSGSLATVTTKLADYLENQNLLHSKVRSAMIYPLLMIAVSIIVLSFLFTFVIPKIVKIFADTKASLPFITKVLILISNIFANYWWLIVFLLIFLIFAIKRLMKKNKLLIDKALLKLPGNLTQSLYYSRFARTLSFLLEGGIPLLKALSISSRSTGNKALELAILETESKIAEGLRLSNSLKGFPSVFTQLISVGEKSGNLAESLKKAADTYEQEFNRKMIRIITILEPTMIITMGLIVCFIVLAVLLPIFQLNQLIK